MTTKNVLSELVARHKLDINSMSEAQYQTLISELDMKVYLTDFHNNSEAMHVIICRDIEDMYIVLFVHIADDNSTYFASVHEVTASLIDAVRAMNEQLIVDYS